MDGQLQGQLVHLKFIWDGGVIHWKVPIFWHYIPSNCVNTLDPDEHIGDLLSQAYTRRIYLNLVRVWAGYLHIDKGVLVHYRLPRFYQVEVLEVLSSED